MIDHCSDNMSNASLELMSKSNSNRSASLASSAELNDDLPLISLIRPSKRSSKSKTPHTERYNISVKPDENFPKSMSESKGNQQTVVGRKRVRLVLSDDEGDVHDEVECSERMLLKCRIDVAASDDCELFV